MVEDIFKRLVWDSLVKLALSRLFAAIPLLGWGPIGLIVTWVAGHYADKLFEVAIKFINVTAIRFKNAQLEEEYTKASINLAVLAAEKGIDSEEFRKAQDEEATALSKYLQH